MKRIDGKSVLFGFGLGIILTAMAGLIFTTGYRTKLTDSEIMAQALLIGMLDPYSGNNDMKRNEDGSLTVSVKEGETLRELADKLYDAGLVTNKVEFELLIKRQDSGALKAGSYVLWYHDSPEAIMSKLINPEQEPVE